MHHKKLPYIIAGSAVFLLVFLLAAFLLQPKQKTDGRIQVVAAENSWGSIAAQIGGDHTRVTSIISDPGADPHLYESGAKDASVITSADIIIMNGLGYDDFVSRLLDASPNSNRVIIKAADVLNAKDGDNPHLWYNISRAATMAAAIKNNLAAKDPVHSADYAKNLTDFSASLQPLLATLHAISAAHPLAPVAYTERVPEYFAREANLVVKSPAGFASATEAGNEPSPADQAAMLSLITKKQIRVLLYNPQADSLATETIRAAAEKNNIPVVVTTETMPKKFATYQEWQKAQLDELFKALENTK